MMKLYFPKYEVEQSYACVHACSVASVVSDSLWLYGLSSTRLLCPWDSLARILEWVSCPPPGDLPDPGIKPTVLTSPALAGGFCITNASQESQNNHLSISKIMGFPGDSDGKESVCNAGDLGSIPGKKIPWRRKWQPTPVFLSGEFHGQRSLVSYSMGSQQAGHDWVTNTYPKWPYTIYKINLKYIADKNINTKKI